MSSSLIEVVSGQLAAAGVEAVELDDGQVMALIEVLGLIPDRRRARGRRYRLGFLLAAALTAVLAGAKSMVEVVRRTRSADDEFLYRLGATGRNLRPADTTFGRALKVLDGDEVDMLCGSWLAGMLRSTERDALRPRNAGAQADGIRAARSWCTLSSPSPKPRCWPRATTSPGCSHRPATASASIRRACPRMPTW